MSTGVYFKGIQLLELLRANAQCKSPPLHPQNLPKNPFSHLAMTFSVRLALGLWDMRVTSLKQKSLGFFASYKPSLNHIQTLFDLQGCAGGGSSKLSCRSRPQSDEFRWLWLVQVPFQHQRTILEGAAQEQVLFSLAEVAMKEVKKGNYPACNRCIHVLGVSCHRAWSHPAGLPREIFTVHKGEPVQRLGLMSHWVCSHWESPTFTAFWIWW